MNDAEDTIAFVEKYGGGTLGGANLKCVCVQLGPEICKKWASACIKGPVFASFPSR